MRDALFGTAHALAAWALSLPLIYQGLVREHAYGLATQGFAAWAGEQWIALGINTLLTALAVAVLYAIMRRAGRRWQTLVGLGRRRSSGRSGAAGDGRAGLHRPAVQHLSIVSPDRQP